MNPEGTFWSGYRAQNESPSKFEAGFWDGLGWSAKRGHFLAHVTKISATGLFPHDFGHRRRRTARLSPFAHLCPF